LKTLIELLPVSLGISLIVSISSARSYAETTDSIEKTQTSESDFSPDFDYEGRGIYIGGAARSEAGIVGGEIGGFLQTSRWLSCRGSLAFLAAEDISEDVFGGLNLGFRINVPFRISPFVGLGGFVGYNRESVLAEDDFKDNDEDGSVDERGETKRVLDDTVGALYPEVGVHLWLSENVRVTGGAAYYITTEGRRDDFWFYGLSIAFRFN